ncbi:TfoX/Sxy family protein [Hyphomicrobium sp.]|uniref:TfoX/Sxy family protein n=1 Tax=Hyphomicrobium sp. TaxID=82 RepID=UPI000F965173|nr:TfoX/Sxy family protein [Hyphomicrobium sp.]RUO99356.1 MAG: TfoX family protein [Hyphomicrobium sp.]
MSANEDLLQILKDALERDGSVSGRRMFGGLGVYSDGTFFAIITGGTIYLKTSDAGRTRFADEGSAAFSYTTKTGRTQLTSYWRLPDRLLDEPDELQDWARASISAAREVAAAKTPRRSPAKAKRKKPAR